MRIDYLRVINFKGFPEREFNLHPEFNLLVGVNGTGKTSVLEAMSIAAASWFLGFKGCKTRHIKHEEVYLDRLEHRLGGAESAEVEVTWEAQYPCEIEAGGVVLGRDLTWRRTLNGPNGRTTRKGASDINDFATKTAQKVKNSTIDEDVILPLVSSYGTGRLWDQPRRRSRVTSEKAFTKKKQSRLAGYEYSTDQRISVKSLTEWIARQDWIAFQRKNNSAQTTLSRAVREAIVGCIDGAERLYFDANYGETILEMDNQPAQPFENLSDGQRTMLALVGDIATKAAKLNPHLGAEVLKQTPGIVLIDELDLHLHPRWQRGVIEDLRTTFPKIQFVCTTHSPFLIQSLRSGEELTVLDGQPPANVGDMPIEKIAHGIQRVSDPSASERYLEMKGVARDYLEKLEDIQGEPADIRRTYVEDLEESIAPYADNPAFQAFLEMQRVAKLGE